MQMLSRSLFKSFAINTNKIMIKFTTAKKIKDSDELSSNQILDILGHQINQSQANLQQKSATTKQKKQVISTPETQIQEKNKTYFYGLMPLKNQNYPMCVDPHEVILEQTPNQNIFKALQLQKSSSFAQYANALNKFRTQVELYGNQQQKDVILNDSLQFKSLLHPQSQYIQFLRKKQMINISIPGTIECEDPRNFMQLRPIEQFRHTPLIPISESYMKKHQEMLDNYHRKQFVFEVSTQKIMNWTIFAACAAVGGYMIYMVLQKQEERTVNFSRMKYQRMMGQSQEKPVFRM